MLDGNEIDLLKILNLHWLSMRYLFATASYTSHSNEMSRNGDDSPIAFWSNALTVRDGFNSISVLINKLSQCF